MIELYAAILLTLFQQSTTGSPIDWQMIILAIIGAGGIAVTIVGIVGAVVIDKVKTANAAHLVAVNESLESVKAERVQDTNLSEALTNLADSTNGFLALLDKTATTAEARNESQFRMANLMSEQNDLFARLTKKVHDMKTDLGSGREEIISRVAEKINDTDTKAATRHTEDAALFSAVRADVAAVKSDLDEKATEILRRLDEKPSTQGYQEIMRQFTNMLTEIKTQLATIEGRLPAPTSPPTTDGAALAGDGVIAPVVPTEGTKQ